MNKAYLNIVAAAAVFLGLAGCTTTEPYSYDTPIMSATEARTMIQVEVKVIEPAPAAPVLVAAAEHQAP